MSNETHEDPMERRVKQAWEEAAFLRRCFDAALGLRPDAAASELQTRLDETQAENAALRAALAAARHELTALHGLQACDAACPEEPWKIDCAGVLAQVDEALTNTGRQQDQYIAVAEYAARCREAREAARERDRLWTLLGDAFNLIDGAECPVDSPERWRAHVRVRMIKALRRKPWGESEEGDEEPTDA